MNKIKMTWVTADKIKKEDLTKEIRQVYCWVFTKDQRLIIVSKDGENWQFPGGKPKENEKPTTALIREVREETGIDIGTFKNNLNFFGYYLVEKKDRPRTSIFLQLRFFLIIDKKSSELNLHAQYEDQDQKDTDIVKHVLAVTISDACKKIPWLSTTEEYAIIKSKINNE
jgi:8-oxo-dGTP pyrophosphatase MutT (NUDIX family)